jgi:large-conductance mechanosensitive channel
MNSNLSKQAVKDFIEHHKLAALSVSFLFIHSASTFINSIVVGFIMPLTGPLIGTENTWRTHEFTLGPFEFEWGQSVAAGFHLFFITVITVVVLRSFTSTEQEKSS